MQLAVSGNFAVRKIGRFLLAVVGVILLAPWTSFIKVIDWIGRALTTREIWNLASESAVLSFLSGIPTYLPQLLGLMLLAWAVYDWKRSTASIKSKMISLTEAFCYVRDKSRWRIDIEG